MFNINNKCHNFAKIYIIVLIASSCIGFPYVVLAQNNTPTQISKNKDPILDLWKQIANTSSIVYNTIHNKIEPNLERLGIKNKLYNDFNNTKVQIKQEYVDIRAQLKDKNDISNGLKRFKNLQHKCDELILKIHNAQYNDTSKQVSQNQDLSNRNNISKIDNTSLDLRKQIEDTSRDIYNNCTCKKSKKM